jgi:hypothetical protein
MSTVGLYFAENLAWSERRPSWIKTAKGKEEDGYSVQARSGITLCCKQLTSTELDFVCLIFYCNNYKSSDINIRIHFV